MKKIIVGISAADGVQIGKRLLELLHECPGVETHLVMSRNAERNFQLECNLEASSVKMLADYVYEPENMAASISSGSFQTDGMIIAPCSMKTLSAISLGYSDNLLARAADVCLKERRTLILIPREMPLSLIHLRNMVAVTEAGGIMLPPMLTFYNSPKNIQDQIDHVLYKALIQFGISSSDFKAWQGC